MLTKSILVFKFLQHLRLVELTHISHTHRHADEFTRHNTGMLDETNTATELEGSAATSRGTLGTSDATPTFLTVLSRAFPKEEFPPPHECQPVGIVHALII